MAHFAQAFWSNDYAGGLGVLFGKLQQGVQENQQILTIARMRADAEELYGQHMGDIGPATDRIPDGFQKDDGASVRKAYEGVRTEMEEAARKHQKIASNIRELVVYPFGRWCDQHAARVQNSQDDLQTRVKAHDKQFETAKKLRAQYFNKCRLVEDLEEEDKLAFKDPQVESSPSPKIQTPTVKVQEPDEEDEPEPIEIGDEVYQPEQLKAMLIHMLESIRLGETKVPILGTYHNVSTGAAIVEYIQQHMNAATMSYAEKIGQDLVAHGFLRLVGNVGSVFANSSRMYYQWRPKVFQITGLPDKSKPLGRSNTVLSADGVDAPIAGTVGEYLAGWNPLNNAHPNETPGQKLKREAREADEKYKAAVKKLDLLRCTLEEAMIEHLRFMERYETDRLRAIKSVILDFSGAISNVIPSLQSTVDKMMLFQETVQPLGDLRYLLENYRTGPFVPKVQIYQNYYNSVDEQTFGVDLEARAKVDRKRVPLIITTILTFLDHHYPLLEGDEARRAIWLVDVPLAATHRLRNEINNGQPIPPEVLEKYEVPIVASVLKLYLLELPDSIVSSTLYEIIKTIYTNPTTASATGPTNRITVLINTLGQLRLANIASLDALTTHFARLIDLTSADESYIATLAQGLAPCILRPRTESAISFEEKYNYRFTRDLLNHKEAIFGELKRASTISHSASVMRAAASIGDQDGRARAISTDESKRRAHMEERNRAIASRSRASSPTPGSRDSQHPTIEAQRHRRDSSRGPSETRFPVNATATPRVQAAAQVQVQNMRHSLEVPASGESTPTRGSSLDTSVTNGHVMASESSVQVENPVSASSTTPNSASTPASAGEGDKHNSFGRAGPRLARKPGSGSGGVAVGSGLARSAGLSQRDSAGSLGEKKPVGVELMDAPMDD